MPDTPAILMDKAIKRLTRTITLYVMKQTDGMSLNQVLDYMGKLNMSPLVEQLGFTGDLLQIQKAQLQLLKNFQATAPISGKTIQSLVEVNQATFMQYTVGYAEAVKGEIVKAVLAGTPRNQMVNAIEIATSGSNIAMSRAQIKTVVDTAVKTFTRQVNAVMSEALPADTKYVYIGKTDEKTRPICLAMISAGALERSEIEERFPGSFIDGGGFNCRHRWAVQTDLSNKFTDPQEARVRLAAQDINPDTLQTPAQAS